MGVDEDGREHRHRHTTGRRARSLLVDGVSQPPPPADAGIVDDGDGDGESDVR